MPDLEEIAARDFDLAQTLNCGQVFHWQREGAGYAGVIGAVPVYAEQHADKLLFTRGHASLISRYLALDHPLPCIYASFPSDPTMRAALDDCRGLRIVRQPLWECLATFITSALKQVGHIALISHHLRQRFGEPVGEIANRTLFAYPTVERMAGLQEAELRACGLGFRAVSLLATARQLAESGGEASLETLRHSSREEALAKLTQFRGVGTKVANCVLLFGYEHLDAFPIDVWIERVLRETYFRAEPDAPLAKLQKFAAGYFGQYGGYAQQYLFHHARATASKVARRKRGESSEDSANPSRRVRAAKTE